MYHRVGGKQGALTRGRRQAKYVIVFGEILCSRQKKSPGFNKTCANLRIIMSIQKCRKQNIYRVITFIKVLKQPAANIVSCPRCISTYVWWKVDWKGCVKYMFGYAVGTGGSW